MNRFALWLADLCIRFVGRGDHTFGYQDRVLEARQDVAGLSIYGPRPWIVEADGTVHLR